MSKATGRALLAAFVIVDLVLVVGVVRHVNRTPPPADIPVDAAATPSAEATSGAKAQSDYTFRRAASWTISVGDDGTVVTASRGRCDDEGKAAKVLVSADGGASERTAAVDLTEVLAVSVVSRTDIKVVGATSSCDVQERTSTDGGATWTTSATVTLWHPDVDNDKTVVTPSGRTKPGCTVTSLSQVGSDFGRVTCSDGTILGTGNGGDKWLKLGRLDNVRVASFSTFNAGYALAVYQGCAAQEFTTRDSGRSWAPGGCISGEPAQAIGTSDTSMMAVVDSTLYASDDAGKSWKQP